VAETRGTHGFPSYLFDRHKIRERLEWRSKRSDQTLATPIIAFWKSSSELTPSVAYSMAYMMVKNEERGKKKVSLMSSPGPFPEQKNNKKEDTRLVQPYLTRALCLWLGDGPAVPVHDRSLGARCGGITADVSRGTRRGERPPRRGGESVAETMFRS